LDRMPHQKSMGKRETNFIEIFRDGMDSNTQGEGKTLEKTMRKGIGRTNNFKKRRSVRKVKKEKTVRSQQHLDYQHSWQKIPPEKRIILSE